MKKEESDQSEKHNVVPDPNQKSEAVVDGDEGHTPENVFPFCLVLTWPRDADANSTIREVVRLFEEKDQRLFQISEKIREKAVHREDVISDWKDLKRNYLNRLNETADDKRELLNSLYMVLENMSLPRASSNNQEKLENHKLNFRMLHKAKNLAQEKQLLREIDVSKQRDNASTSPLENISHTLLGIQWRHKDWYQHRNNLKICEKLLEEIKKFEVTRKTSEGLREAIRNQVKITCDGLMELMKKRRPLEMKRKQLEEEIEAMNEEIRSFQKHLKEKQYRKEASLFVLRGSDSDDFWFLRHCNLEYDSLFSSGILRKKSSLKKF